MSVIALAVCSSSIRGSAVAPKRRIDELFNMSVTETEPSSRNAMRGRSSAMPERLSSASDVRKHSGKNRGSRWPDRCQVEASGNVGKRMSHKEESVEESAKAE